MQMTMVRLFSLLFHCQFVCVHFCYVITAAHEPWIGTLIRILTLILMGAGRACTANCYNCLCWR